MPKYKAAIVGCGRMGGFIDDEVPFDSSSMLPYSHAQGYLESPHTDLVAGCDPDPDRLQRWGERFTMARTYHSIGDMMAAEQPDFVSVATPTAPRREVTLAVAAGRPKAIYVEKPMAETLADCDAMIAACRDIGAYLIVNTSRRWHPVWHRARELIERDYIGPPRTIVAYMPAMISHNGSHLLDTLLHLVGSEVDWVVGHVTDEQKVQTEHDLPACGLLHFKDDVHAYVNTIDCGPTSTEIDIVAERGRIRIGANGLRPQLWTLTGEGKARHLAERPFPLPARMQAPVLNAIDDLVAAVETGTPPRGSGEDGRAVLEIALALRESHRRGNTRVNLPFTDLQARIISV